ncbi:MAG: hypothetical protein ACKOWG_09455, partial [Planctomycetia bacterium]
MSLRLFAIEPASCPGAPPLHACPRNSRQPPATPGTRMVWACQYPEEVEEVVEDLFEEIFRRELK